MGRWGAAVAGSWLVLAGFAAGQAPPAKIIFIDPTSESYVTDWIVIRVALSPPSLKVRRVSFYADDKLVCVVDGPPLECKWNAGLRVEPHAFRVVAQLADGPPLSASIRTKGDLWVENVNVDLIQVTASVTDEQGNFVRGLQRGDFRVFENDVSQKIEEFWGQNVALELIVAVDMSGSLVDDMPKVRRSVRQFLTALRPQDQVWLMAFNDKPVTLARPSVDLATRLKTVDRLAGWGGTALYDVIAQSMETLGKKTGRRALVVFSDGEDTTSRIRRDAAEKRVQQSDAVIYTIGQGRGTTRRELKQILEGFARVSGGRAFFTDSADKLDEAFSQIVEELANQYLITYTPPHPEWNGTWRRITVKVSDTRLKVKHRQGYLR